VVRFTGWISKLSNLTLSNINFQTGDENLAPACVRIITGTVCKLAMISRKAMCTCHLFAFQQVEVGTAAMECQVLNTRHLKEGHPACHRINGEPSQRQMSNAGDKREQATEGGSVHKTYPPMAISKQQMGEQLVPGVEQETA
jgi:hypothetical protein